MRVPAFRSEEALALELLERERVLVHPGYFFDFPHEAYIVVSLIPPPDQFADAFARALRFACDAGFVARASTRDNQIVVPDSSQLLPFMTFGSNDRRAGMLVPLFSMPSARSWGIGEIGDLERMTAWLAGAGQRLLQLLPITETSPDDPSPYGSLSAMAIDPQYISLADMEDFAAIGGERAPRRPSSSRRSIACARLRRSTTAPSAS